ncbi:helix-turn-helix domain-containing protein [Spongiactinospora sp. TRM90649]|uniref:helix-turn-helix domain-containing protein n=1 Tax=Spongiactinospora sp. TRM90649 TaxID=3031114 RepID=UPI0023F768E2|nr:helix-turn-helix domain-containing protein [Spongiactinospora sp. TRM90649]MDF5751095.1 helix-turn-helix domain-containing protein [Spongiactinospora sp. TRM90649]
MTRTHRTTRGTRPTMRKPLPTPEMKPTLSVPEAGTYLGLSKSSSYDAAKRGEIPTIPFGRLLRVPTATLRQMLGIDPVPVTEPGTLGHDPRGE